MAIPMVIFNLNNRITIQNISQKTENQPKSKQKSSTEVPTGYFVIVREASPAYDFKEQCTRKCKLKTVNRILPGLQMNAYYLFTPQ